MSVTPVTPQPGSASSVTTGGTAVVAIPPNPNGGFITNPAAVSDQGLSNTEPLYINPVTEATLDGNGTTFALAPGETWKVIPGQTTATSVNAASNGHKFSAVFW